MKPNVYVTSDLVYGHYSDGMVRLNYRPRLFRVGDTLKVDHGKVLTARGTWWPRDEHYVVTSVGEQGRLLGISPCVFKGRRLLPAPHFPVFRD